MRLAIVEFIKERFQPKATVLISIILFSAPFLTVTRNSTNYFSGVMTTFIILLTIRIADDLTSLDEDKSHHPQRGLVSGRIDRKALIWSLSYLGVFICILNLSAKQIGILTFIFIYYALFFFFRTKTSLLLKPFFSNAIFLVLPFYATGSHILNENPRILFLGLFLWAGAIAHEYSHNVHDLEEKTEYEKTYSTLLGPRNAAILSLILFLSSFLFGVLFWYFTGKSYFFICTLVLLTLHMLYHYQKIIKKPCDKNAQPFYIFGFTYFLLPLCAFIVDYFL